VCSPPTTNGRYTDGQSAAATQQIIEALQTGVVHGSLVERGVPAKYA